MEAKLKVRYRGHSCVEIDGKHHVLIDPDFTRPPDPDVEYVCITHAHRDHIGRVAQLPAGIVVASPDVCEIAGRMGVPRDRLHPVEPGQQVGPIKVLPGYSPVDEFLYTLFSVAFRWRLPDPGGTPLSFLVMDEISLLHIGDAYRAPLAEKPDLFCLPWRTSPLRDRRYKAALIEMANQFLPRYILPIHYDLEHSLADPAEIDGRIGAVLLDGYDWHSFRNRELVD